jgi:hypothetical protein
VLTWSSPEANPGRLGPMLYLLDPHTDLTHDLGPAAVDAHSLVWWHTMGGWHLTYLALTPPGLHAGVAVFDLAVPATGAAAVHRNLSAGMPACPSELVQVDRGRATGAGRRGPGQRDTPTRPRRTAADGSPGGQLTTNRGDAVAAIASAATVSPYAESVASTASEKVQ